MTIIQVQRIGNDVQVVGKEPPPPKVLVQRNGPPGIPGAGLVDDTGAIANNRARSSQWLNKNTSLNVRDYATGAWATDGTMDITAAFAAAVAAVPPLSGIQAEPSLGFKYETQGGARIKVPRGTYQLSSLVTLPGGRFTLEAEGVTFLLTTAGAAIKIPDQPVAGLFSASGAEIAGHPVIDGQNIATNGLLVGAIKHGKIDAKVVRTTGDGILCSGTQFTKFDVEVLACGGWAFTGQPYDPTATRVPAFNSNDLTRSRFHTCGLGGLNIAGGQNNVGAFISAFHTGANAPAARISGAESLGNDFEGAWLENCPVMLFIDANDVNKPGRPQNTRFGSVVMYSDQATPVTYRYVINQGISTRIEDPITDPQGPPVSRNGVWACYEQTAGGASTMKVTNPKLPALSSTFTTNGGLLFVDDTTPTARNVDPAHPGAVNVGLTVVSFAADCQFAADFSTAGQMGFIGSKLLPTTTGTNLGSGGLPWQVCFAQSIANPPTRVAHTGGTRAIQPLGTGDTIITASGNITSMTLANPGADGFTTRITVAATATITIAWPTNVRWSGGTAPTTPASGSEVTVTLRWDNTNSLWKQIGPAVTVTST